MMQVWDSVSAWRDRRAAIGGQPIGFVPTMGALHRGHASLVERCRAENPVAVVSIFVNPTQFNDPQDLERYPRTLDRDLALLESLGVDDVLAPGHRTCTRTATAIAWRPRAGPPSWKRRTGPAFSRASSPW